MRQRFSVFLFAILVGTVICFSAFPEVTSFYFLNMHSYLQYSCTDVFSLFIIKTAHTKKKHYCELFLKYHVSFPTL